MTVSTLRALGSALIVAAAAACGGAPEPEPAAPAAETPAAVVPGSPEHLAAVQAWRDKHEEDYRRDWVSIAGLHFLEPGTQTVGSDIANDVVLTAGVPATIGRLIVTDGRITYEPAAGLEVRQNEQPVTGPITLKEAGSPPADEIVIDGVRLVVHVSGERLSLRVRDPNGELARGFLGFRWFPIDPDYRATGRFIRDAEPTDMTVLNTFGDMDTYPTEGVIEFTLHGQTLRLRPFTSRPNRFYIVFRDASAGEETYETARFLYADLLEDGTTVLDFNQAYNPPCSFNPYTTCPIPLPENVLPVRILAGEQAYPVHVELPTGAR